MRGRDNKDATSDRWSRKDWWGIVIDAPDGSALLHFYAALLDKPVHTVGPSGGSLDFGEGVAYLAVQTNTSYVPPVWPAPEGAQQMMLHLDFEVSDLAASVAHALELGATMPDFQPQDDVRVLLDPAGHPFCLYT
jgi:hypothetical protein